MKSIARTAMLAIGLTGLAMTAACSGGGEEAPVETNVSDIGEPENEAPVENVTEPLPPPVANETRVELPPTQDFSDAEQTQEDADATGMTARVNRDEDNGTQPAE